MSLSERISREKAAVAHLLAALELEPSAREKVVGKLDVELKEQCAFDHRDFTPEEVNLAWLGTPSLENLLQRERVLFDESILKGLVEATYAFRLLTLAHLHSELGRRGGRRDLFLKCLDHLGHTMAEVEAYQVDFVAS
ncbi:MAG: hypothetical protein H6686_00980 [Fibrobacteria bacterium]|nr:hypothetical protein [Fibrobacteria bacterium]